MSQNQRPLTCRVQFLAKYTEITTLHRKGYFAKTIHTKVGLADIMSYASFARLYKLLIKTRGKTRQIAKNKKGQSRAIFLRHLPRIQELHLEGYCAKDIQQQLGLDRALSYPSFVRYFSGFVARKQPITPNTSGESLTSQIPHYDPQLTSGRVRSWAPPDPWPDM